MSGDAESIEERVGSLYRQWGETGAIGPLNEAIDLLQAKISAQAVDPELWQSLAYLYRRRYDSSRDTDDLQRCSSLLQAALDAGSLSQSRSAVVTHALAEARCRFFQATGDTEVRDHSIGLYRDAAGLAEQAALPGETQQIWRNDLFAAIQSRYADADSPADLRELAETLDQIIEADPETDALKLDTAVGYWGDLVRRSPSREVTQRWVDAGERLRAAYDRGDAPGIEGWSVAFALGAALLDRWEYEEHPYDLDRAITELELAHGDVDAIQGNPRAVQSLLVRALAYRAATYGGETDLDRSIALHTELMEDGGTPEAGDVAELADLKLRRYIVARDPTDLESAIMLVETQLPAASGVHADMLRDILGALLHERFQRTDDASELKRALGLFESVLVSPDATLDPVLVNRARANYGLCLSARTRTTGDLADLAAGVRELQLAAEEIEPAYVRAGRLSSLASVLAQNYHWTGDQEALSHAIRCAETAVELTPGREAHRVRRSHNLASLLDDRFAASGARSDLERAIEVLEDLIGSTAGGEDAVLRNSLARDLRIRAKTTGSAEDLSRALELSREAVALAPTDYVRGHCHLTLGRIVLDRFYDDNDRELLTEARKQFVAAAAVAERDPEVAVEGAKGAGLIALLEGRFAVAVGEFRRGVQRISELSAAQVARSHRERWLSELRTLSVGGSVAAVANGALPDAVLFLEQGRAQLLTYALRLAAVDLAALAAGEHASLAQAFRRAADRVLALEAAAVESA